jgi:hypothetical protein
LVEEFLEALRHLFHVGLAALGRTDIEDFAGFVQCQAGSSGASFDSGSGLVFL